MDAIGIDTGREWTFGIYSPLIRSHQERVFRLSERVLSSNVTIFARAVLILGLMG
jgi:hypothetical protein